MVCGRAAGEFNPAGFQPGIGSGSRFFDVETDDIEPDDVELNNVELDEDDAAMAPLLGCMMMGLGDLDMDDMNTSTTIG